VQQQLKTMAMGPQSGLAKLASGKCTLRSPIDRCGSLPLASAAYDRVSDHSQQLGAYQVFLRPDVLKHPTTVVIMFSVVVKATACLRIPRRRSLDYVCLAGSGIKCGHQYGVLMLGSKGTAIGSLQLGRGGSNQTSEGRKRQAEPKDNTVVIDEMSNAAATRSLRDWMQIRSQLGSGLVAIRTRGS
jgi:hypothetical protein